MNSSPSSAQTVLQVWCDALVAHQVSGGDDRGGFGCPACRMVHGRSADAVYPLMAMFARTRDERYRVAALDVFDWSQRHVSQSDGSYHNEIDVDWKGITCFSLITLGETLRHYADHLAPATVELWRTRLRRGADFLLDFIGFETGDINYPISTAAALALSSTVLGDEKYSLRARELAHFGLRHFTTNGLLWGEGERGPNDATPRGLRPIDVPYNVEESLPNLALYALLTHDEEVLQAVTQSLRAHLSFLLPDGGWDAGWCARQYKWTYWGSRTSDGCPGGYAVLRDRDARFASAAALNLQLLERCTRDGLLGGGPHLHARELPACIHHTFCHAKALALALDSGWNGEGGAPLDKPRGVRQWSEAAVVQIAVGSWRASITANDLAHTQKRGGYPSGGALSLLWHEKTGPLCVASMTDYVRYEGRNMQVPADESERFVLTPRLELQIGEDVFSNLFEREAVLQWSESGGQTEITARGTLKTRDGFAAPNSDFLLSYRFVDEACVLEAQCDAPGARWIVPLVSTQDEAIDFRDETLEIAKSGATLRLRFEESAPQNVSSARVFNFVPGVEALPLIVPLSPNRTARIRFTVGDS